MITNSDKDIFEIESKLRSRIAGEVRFDAGSIALYTSDASNYRQIPIGVVIPRSTDDVIATIATAREFGASVLSRGAGTSIAGQCCNVAIVMDFSKYLNKIVEIDPVKKTARVQPGGVLDHLRNAAEQYGLTFGPDPATHKWCTLGGMIGNNSCGVHSVMAGRTVDNLHALDVALYDGTRMYVGMGNRADSSSGSLRERAIYEGLQRLAHSYGDEIRRRFPQIPRRVSGYSIDQLLPEHGFHVARSLAGSEGTLVTILEATVQLIPSPTKRLLLVVGFSDIATAGDHVSLVMEHKPVGLEGIDERFLRDVRTKQLHLKYLPLFPDGKGWLIAEFGGETIAAARSAAEGCATSLRRSGALVDFRIYDNPEMQGIWSVRDSALGAISRVPGEHDNWEGWEDSAVPPARIGAYIRDFQKLLAQYGYSAAVYGHIGEGCMHNRIDWDPKSKDGIAHWREFVEDASDLVLSYGGSFSGEHGDGQARGELLPKMFGPQIMRAFEEFKTIWDPDWKMNPGKLIRPYRIDEHLRYGEDYSLRLAEEKEKSEVITYFQFPDDEGSFARATERCVGAGVCRREDGGVMCPSYRATREEEHVTRGRAHLLWEMLHGDVITEGWKSEDVKDALSLCLACKGCKSDCPVRVDVATYKAEFLSHYYEDKIRPRAAYSMGMIDKSAKLASKAPRLANWLTHSTLTRGAVKRFGGIHPKREIPVFAKETFKHWFFNRPKPSSLHPSSLSEGGKLKQVILWADTFNNYFRPETAKAAVRVLEAAGYFVKVYQKTMCCGRPLYDWGMLKQARYYIDNILNVMGNEISAGIPMVVLEPSCASVFRDELRNLMPEREDAARLRESTYLLSEFLEKFVPNSPFYGARRDRSVGDIPAQSAIVQFHCHHHAVFGKGAEESVLNKCGVNAEILDVGCCGMAGAFGFEEDKYDVSMVISAQKLIPKIEETPSDHLIIADGFSCREQIEQATGRRTYHLAEVLEHHYSDGFSNPSE